MLMSLLANQKEPYSRVNLRLLIMQMACWSTIKSKCDN